MKALHRLAVGSVLCCVCLSLHAQYSTLTFPYNAEVKNISINGPTYPTGALDFLGVPFFIPTEGDNYYHFYHATDPNPRTLDIPVNLHGVIAVFSLINTYWGKAQGDLLQIEFFGTNGAYAFYDLVGNSDVRDYNNAGYTNNINGITTKQVWTNALGQRIDRQEYQLPSIFASETLETIRLTDNGASIVSRGFVLAMTAEIPEPSTYAFCFGLLALATVAIRRNRRDRSSAGKSAGK